MDPLLPVGDLLITAFNGDFAFTALGDMAVNEIAGRVKGCGKFNVHGHQGLCIAGAQNGNRTVGAVQSRPKSRA